MNDMDFALSAFLDTHETVLKINVINGDLVFLKNKEGNIPLNTILSQKDFLDTYFTHVEIHPDDLFKFEIINQLSEFKKLCDERQGGVLFSFRRLLHEEYRWIRIALSIPEIYSEEFPYVLLSRRDLPLWESDQEEALNSFQKKILKIMKFNLTTNVSRILKQLPSEDYIKRKHGKGHFLSEEWTIEEGLIHPEDLQHFKHFTDHTFIMNFFEDGNEELSFFYRRKIGSFFRWVKLSITRSTEYDSYHKVFLYIIEDVDSVLTDLLNQHGFFQYSKLKASRSDKMEIYYDNLLHALSYFTQRYIYFYMVDLKKDLYIMYKIQQENVSGDFPYVGSYSELSKLYARQNLSTDQQDTVMPFTSSEALTRQLMDKASLEFSFVNKHGQKVTTICTKIESVNGVPSKVICCTVPAHQEKQLRVKTFGNFEVLDETGKPMKFTRKQGKELLAYLIDRQGYPASSTDIVQDIFERDPEELNAIKYVSTVFRSAAKDLEKAGYPDVIIKEWNSLRVDTNKIDCDYYRLIHGDVSYLNQYHNEYMKEYSWAEETNAEILHYSSRF